VESDTITHEDGDVTMFTVCIILQIQTQQSCDTST